MQVQMSHDEEKSQKSAEAQQNLRKEIADQKKARKAAAHKRRNDVIAGGSVDDRRTDEEIVQDQIDSVAEDIPDLISPPAERVKRHKRPQNWEDIATEAQIYGNRQAAKSFPEEFLGISETAVYQRLNLLKKDFESKRDLTVASKVGLASYGTEIDLKLLADCESSRSCDLSIDDVILRRFLKVRLIQAGKEELLRENGGSHDYGHSWAMQFYWRHNLVLRVCTTEMRELPMDFEAKKRIYMRIGADLVFRHNVPPELVINGDETAVQFVNRARTTRCAKGVKQVKILGMGDDEAQTTTTIFVTEAGNVL